MKKDPFFAVTGILIIFSTIEHLDASGIALLSTAFVGGKGLLCCKCKYIVHIIELSCVQDW